MIDFSPCGELMQTLSSIHQSQHQALFELHADLQQGFEALLQELTEDQQVLRNLAQPTEK